MTQEDLNQLAGIILSEVDKEQMYNPMYEGQDIIVGKELVMRGFKKALELVGKSGIIEDITGYYAHSDNLFNMLDID